MTRRERRQAERNNARTRRHQTRRRHSYGTRTCSDSCGGSSSEETETSNAESSDSHTAALIWYGLGSNVIPSRSSPITHGNGASKSQRTLRRFQPRETEGERERRQMLEREGCWTGLNLNRRSRLFQFRSHHFGLPTVSPV
jgi:hypothetical protein